MTRQGSVSPSKKPLRQLHYVYMLRCANGDLYTGYTTDPERRVRMHNSGVASKFTRSHLPVTLVHLERFRTRSTALKREVAIKRLGRKEKLELCKVATFFKVLFGSQH